MSLMPIDLDAEAILFEGQWSTRDELARRIKTMLDAGDYAISRQSTALEQLTTTLAAVRTLAFRATPEQWTTLAVEAIVRGAAAGAGIVCFPDCYVPGYRARDRHIPPPAAAFLERAWSTIAAAAARSQIAVVLGTERLVRGTLLATALVIDAQGERLGFQAKVMIDPSEDDP